jgi:membrane-bound serine protease (ClpP class)
VLLTVQDAISPATADYIVRGIEKAQKNRDELVVLALDTPGGLDTAMRNIIQAILASSVPVATFVYPPGARAASAGTYILYASHVAAMAPATNVGAATPVQIGGGQPSAPNPADRSAPGSGGAGSPAPAPDDENRSSPSPGDSDRESPSPGGSDRESPSPGGSDRGRPTDDEAAPPRPATTEERKVINDAVAYIRSLAERRGRNADWAERAVRYSESLSARAALDRGVIDLIADDVPDLLAKVDGMEVMLPTGSATLRTADATLERFDPDWRTRLLAVISNPTVAYILMLIGIYGLVLEGYNPGGVLPGVVGGISLLLALFSFQILPVNYAGLALIVLGVILMISETLVPSFGALGFGGIASFVLGSVILIDVDVPGFGISRPLIGAIAAVGGLAVLGTAWLAIRSRQRPVVSGTEELTRQLATALESFETEGDVWIHGERWRARSPVPVRKGQKLDVRRVDGLLLHVEPVDAGPADAAPIDAAPAGQSAAEGRAADSEARYDKPADDERMD